MLILFAVAMLGAPATLPSPVSPVARRPGDLAPCPGINPDIRRPLGSNCLGIVPRQCGADRVRRFLGKPANRANRVAVEGTVEHDRIRWIRPGEAVTQDLRADRLNVMLNPRGRISKIDCF